MREYFDIENISRVALPVIRFTAERRLSELELRLSNLGTEIFDVIGGDLVMRLYADIVCEELQEIRYPKDWWQAFKERWYPKWLLKRFPVQYTVINPKVLYPEISLPDKTAYFKIMKKEQ